MKIFKRFLEMMKRGWMLFLELLCADVQHVGVFAVRVKSEETAELRKNNIARPGDAAGRVRSTFFWPLKTGAVRAGGKGARLPIICASVCPPQRDLHSLCCVCPVRARLLGRCFLYPPVLKDFAAWQLPFFRKTPTDEKSAARLLIEKRFFLPGRRAEKGFSACKQSTIERNVFNPFERVGGSCAAAAAALRSLHIFLLNNLFATKKRAVFNARQVKIETLQKDPHLHVTLTM
jgi:hypothetical protein